VVGGDELRAAMRRFPAGVAVLTLDADGLKVGVTVGSLVSLSLEPPLVGVSIGLDSSAHEPIRVAGRFAVNVLAGDQAHVAQHFARSGVPPLALFAGIALRDDTRTTEPLIANAAAWLGCVIRDELPAGDHTIFLADVESIELGRDGPGLAYLGGEYHGVG
jgi:flavin reductase (DIM6/NTAB) family NADH-FMN oxidoreductase RutF